MEWCGRSGKVLPTIGEPTRQASPVLSPDNRTLAVANLYDFEIWLHDLTRKPDPTDLPPGHSVPHEVGPPKTRSPILSDHTGNWDIFSKPADGSGEASPLVSTPADEEMADWSVDRRFLIYEVESPKTKSDLFYRERGKDGKLSDPVVFS